MNKPTYSFRVENPNPDYTEYLYDVLMYQGAEPLIKMPDFIMFYDEYGYRFEIEKKDSTGWGIPRSFPYASRKKCQAILKLIQAEIKKHIRKTRLKHPEVSFKIRPAGLVDDDTEYSTVYYSDEKTPLTEMPKFKIGKSTLYKDRYYFYIDDDIEGWDKGSPFSAHFKTKEHCQQAVKMMKQEIKKYLEVNNG